jgi:polysaccharide export outer membrane protein
MKRGRTHLAVFLVAALAASGAVAQDVSGEYHVGPRDLLEIKVIEVPELNVERRISEGGTISLPMIGDFQVSGRTAAEIRSSLETLLTSKYVNRADVSVVIKEFANKPISILGAVQHPGALNTSGRWSLLQAISAAGGLTEAAGRKILILRKNKNGSSDVFEVRTDDLFRGASDTWNIAILPGDVVNIPARSMVRIFCMGEVKIPGTVELTTDDRITLLSVLAKAGGLTDKASNKIRVKRRDASGRDVETVYNYKRILAGKDPDPVLNGNDVVVVKQSFF